MIALAIAAGAMLAFALLAAVVQWDHRRDDREYPAPDANYTLPSARVISRAGPQIPPAGRHGASSGDAAFDTWLDELREVHHDDGAAFLGAPLPADVPGRATPAPAMTGGERAPATPAPAEAAHPAGDLTCPVCARNLDIGQHQIGCPEADDGFQGEAARSDSLDYKPRVPFANWESDTFVEGLAAIRDGA